MGIDMLDFTCRIEKRFGFKFELADRGSLDEIILPRRGYLKVPDVTAGELHEWVVKLCKRRGMKIPHSSWNRVRVELAQTVGRPPQMIRRETFIVRELGFS